MRVTCTPVNALCMYICVRFNWHIFIRKVPKLWYNAKLCYLQISILNTSTRGTDRWKHWSWTLHVCPNKEV
jgi:hypothetical protein